MGVSHDVHIGAFAVIDLEKVQIGSEWYCEKHGKSCSPGPHCVMCGTKLKERPIMGYPGVSRLLPEGREDNLFSPDFDPTNPLVVICNYNNHGCMLEFDSDHANIEITEKHSNDCLAEFRKNHQEVLDALEQHEAVKSLVVKFGVITCWS